MRPLHPLRLIILLCAVAVNAAAIVPGGLVSNQNDGIGTATWMEVTITVEQEPPSDSQYFWAQQFYPNATVDHGGYLGIQTGGNIGGELLGKIFVFSIWNATAAEAAPGAVAQTFGGEGIGYSVRKAVPWQEGVPYTFRVEKDGPLWWRMQYSQPGADPVYMGRIQITEDVELRSVFVAFTEYYGELPSCEDLPYARTFFSDLMLGGTLVTPGGVAPYGRCIGEARGSLKGNGAVHEVGDEPGPGDANGDGSVAVGDVFYLINHLFAGGPVTLGDGGDANGDDVVTVADIFYLINHLFAGGPAPV